ncbi:MAG: Xaa-Pro peptidase family protein [Candidatus Paceibacterota bacterium]
MTKLLFDTTRNADMRYAVRRSIPDPVFCLECADGHRTVFLNSLEYDTFLENNTDPDLSAAKLEPFIERSRALDGDEPLRSKVALVILREFGLEHEVVEVSATFPVLIADHLRGHGVELEPVSPLYPQRARKTGLEIEVIRENQRKTSEAFALVEGIIREATVAERGELVYGKVSLTSEFLKREVAKFLLDRDIVLDSGIIISSGAQTAMPHHEGSGVLLANEPIVVDIYPRDIASGYYGDMTRTYVKGKPSEKLMAMFEAVSEAHTRAIEEVAPGVPAGKVHQAAAAALENHGFTTDETSGFIHAVGHGLGLELHELPMVSAAATEVLDPGNVITIEPGLYYPGEGGVRTEDAVVVTPDGHELLTSSERREFVL